MHITIGISINIIGFISYFYLSLISTKSPIPKRAFFLHILNYFCFDTISIADNNVFSLIPFPLPTPSFSILSRDFSIEQKSS